MTTTINKLIRENCKLSFTQLRLLIIRELQVNLSINAIRLRYYRLDLPPKRGEVDRVSKKEADNIEADIKSRHSKEDKVTLDKKYKELLKRFEMVQKERDAIKQIPVSYHEIKPRESSGSEAAAVLVASDWHVEEKVDKGVVNGLNEFNLEIARSRAEFFFRNALRLIEINKKELHIKKAVLALLGDFISGSIHEELMEGNELPPIKALLFAQDLIVSGINYLLKNSDIELVIPCHSGNHGRSTQKQRHATEAGNSFEYFMYHNIADHFKNEKRVKFVISEGYHSYLKVFNTTIRFHHGHNVKYGGGVGGLFIPAFKAIGQWNKSSWADLDVFGHLHQFRFGGNFICNGSLIGWNPYAISIKAEYEKPMQTFFLVNSQYGVESLTKIRLF